MCDSQQPQTAEVALSLCPLPGYRPMVMTPADRTGDVGDSAGGEISGIWKSNTTLLWVQYDTIMVQYDTIMGTVRHYYGYSTQHKPNTFHFHTDV